MALPGILRISQEQLDWLARRLAWLFRSGAGDDDSPTLYDVEVKSNTVGMQGSLLLEGDVMRRVLVIGSNSSTVAWISPRPLLGLNQGIPISSAVAPFVFDFKAHKALVTSPWYAISGIAGGILTFTTVIYHPERRSNLR